MAYGRVSHRQFGGEGGTGPEDAKPEPADLSALPGAACLAYCGTGAAVTSSRFEFPALEVITACAASGAAGPFAMAYRQPAVLMADPVVRIVMAWCASQSSRPYLVSVTPRLPIE